LIYLAIGYVRKGKFIKRYKNIELEIFAFSEDEARDEAADIMRGLFPDEIWFIASVAEARRE